MKETGQLHDRITIMWVIELSLRGLGPIKFIEVEEVEYFI